MNYRIGSFNMKNFGMNSQKDFEKIAEIIVREDLDVVALQEILSEGKGVQRLLEQCVKYDLYNWDFCCASPYESDDPEKREDMIQQDRRGECYAYLWKKSRFQLLEFSKMGKTRVFEPRIINSLSNDVSVDCSFFARTPYYIRLQPLYGGFFESYSIKKNVYADFLRLNKAKKAAFFFPFGKLKMPPFSVFIYTSSAISYKSFSDSSHPRHGSVIDFPYTPSPTFWQPGSM